jgi:hypothetical protein
LAKLYLFPSSASQRWHRSILSVELARRYEIPVESLEFHCLCPGDYLLVLPDEAMASRVYNGGRPLQIPPFTVVCRRWSRFKGASGVALPHLLDVELSGIPAHAWELETAEHQLDDRCWVRELHPDTINRRDYSSFRLKAWCERPGLVPAAMDLIIVEPPVSLEVAEPLKRGLCYLIKISMTPVPWESPSGGLRPRPPARNVQGRGGQSRRRRRTSSSLESSPDASTARGAACSIPVHDERLGPGVADGHVAVAEEATEAGGLVDRGGISANDSFGLGTARSC